MRSTSEATGAFVAGWRRVLSAPRLVIGVWLATTLAALPPALAVRSAIEGDLGSSLVASRVAAGVDAGWWQEFQARAQAEATTLSTVVIGAAAPIANWSRFVDAPGVPPVLVVAVAFALGVWIFLSGGAIDRLARARPVGTRAFVGTCGVFFFRFLRLTILVGAAYWLIASPFHAVLFGGVYRWLTRDLSSERVAFAWRLICYAIWLAPLVVVNVVADYAKARAVIEDRRSMLGALAAGGRFVRRHPGAVTAVYVANALVLAVAFSVYLLLAPGAQGGDWRLLAVLGIGQAWIVMRILTRLAFMSTSAALVQRSLAHAEYTATPPPVWPDSPAAEAIENAARFGTRASTR
jgi:hypothetical protein